MDIEVLIAIITTTVVVNANSLCIGCMPKVNFTVAVRPFSIVGGFDKMT